MAGVRTPPEGLKPIKLSTLLSNQPISRAIEVALAVFAVCLTIPSAEVAAQGRAARSVEYDSNRWTLIKRSTVSFVADSVPWQVLLLKSRKPTGSDGLGQPMNDVRILLFHDGKIFYGRTLQFFMDDYLEIRDVTGEGGPEVLFHSGARGASDSSTLEHILRYDKGADSVADVAPQEFFDSGTHGLRWLNLGGRAFLVIANRNWKATTPLEYRCHYCPSPFKYDIYLWNDEKSAFTVYRRLQGKKSYDEAFEALNGDWEFIRRFEQR